MTSSLPLAAPWTVGVGGAVLFALLFAACVTDVRSRRIPNEVVLALMVCGLVYSIVLSPTVITPLRAAGSMLLGLAIWLPFYALRMLGAGDVKLFAAASVWLSPWAVVQAALLSALIGGALGILWFIRSHGLGFAVVRLSHAAQQPRVLREAIPVTSARQRLPYGVAMALGVIVVALRVYTPFF